MTPEALVLILGGCTTVLGAGVAGWQAIRQGAAARQRNIMDDLSKAQDRAEHTARQADIQRRYWETYATHTLMRLIPPGVEVPPPNPPAWVDFEAKK